MKLYLFYQAPDRSRERALQIELEEEQRRNARRLLLLAALEDEESRRRFRDYITLEALRRRDRRLPRRALHYPQSSPWMKLFSSNNDQSLITVTGFDHRSFNLLLEKFEPLFRRYTPWTGNNDGSTFKKISVKPNKRSGRPRLIDAKSALGLALAWYRFRGAEFILQGWFGYTGTPANVWLKFSRRILLICLWRDAQARIEMPSDDRVALLKEAVAKKYPWQNYFSPLGTTDCITATDCITRSTGHNFYRKERLLAPLQTDN